ncbi:MAG: ATP-binding cassette domain-containing protein [Patescibacteria group bacterium]
MIRFQHISKKFGVRSVLSDVHFEIEGEEFVCLIGRSGAGKSTLLHLLLGTQKPDSGKIFVDQFEVTGMNKNEAAKYRQKIGILFQDHCLLPKKTVFENVALPLEMTKNHDSYVHARVTETLHLVGMTGKEKRFPHELSGGEKQKVSLARALVGAPLLLVCDEPTGDLDPIATQELLKLLVKINKGGTTVILSTHHKGVVDLLKKRVVVLKEGKVVSDKKEAGYELESL